MFKKILHAPILAVAFVAGTFTLNAAPIQPARGLPQDAKIVMHADADALRTSKISQIAGVAEKCEGSPVAKKIADAISDITFGAKDLEDSGTLLARGTFSRADVVAFFKEISSEIAEKKIENRNCFVGAIKGESKDSAFSKIGGGLASSIAIEREDVKYAFTFIKNKNGKNLVLLSIGEETDLESALAQAIRDYTAKKSMPVPASLKGIKGAPLFLAAALPGAFKDGDALEMSSSKISITEEADALAVSYTGTMDSEEIAKKRANETRQVLTFVAMAFTMAPMQEEGENEKTPEEAKAEEAVRKFVASALAGAKVSSEKKDLSVSIKFPSEALVELSKELPAMLMGKKEK